MKNPFIFMIVIFVFFFGACTKSDPPVITALTATPSEIFTDEETVLSCEAQASDGAKVTFKWSCDHGAIVGTAYSQTITWISPSEPGVYKIDVEVKDGLKTTTGSLTINVIEYDIEYSSFVDSRDDKEYSYISFMGQSWMAENLAFLPIVNSVEEGSLYEPHYYVFSYKDKIVSEAKKHVNYTNYGVLYNWAAAKSSCPAGWRLPTDEDWKILEKNLGMTVADADTINWRKSGDVGKKLKSKEGWTREGNGINRIGFNAPAGGYRWGDANFSFIQNKAFFWTASTESFDKAWFRQLYYPNDGISRFYHTRDHGCSVRCIKTD